MYIILVYDIKVDEKGQKILNNVFKVCKRYLCHIQNSVFEGELSEGQILKLKCEIDRLIRKDFDSVIIFKSRNKKWLQKEFWGLEDNKVSNII